MTPRWEVLENVVRNGENTDIIFSFFQDVFYPIKAKSQHLSNNDFVVCKKLKLLASLKSFFSDSELKVQFTYHNSRLLSFVVRQGSD